jgi:hypothetical protein
VAIAKHLEMDKIPGMLTFTGQLGMVTGINTENVNERPTRILSLFGVSK